MRDREYHQLRRDWLTTRGALLHRAGRHADAIAELNLAIKQDPDGKGGPVQWAWLALAHAAQKKAPGKEASRWLERARAGKPSRDGAGFWEAVRVELVIAEAEQALRGG